MSYAITRIDDVIQPEVFNPYVVQRTMDLSALIQSGIVQNDPEFDMLASGPNTLINMPFWQDLSGDSEIMSDDGSLTPGKIGSDKDVARKNGRARAWGANGLSALLSGDDPMRAIGDLTADYWQRDMQKVLLYILAGVFGAASMAANVHDISLESGDASLINAPTFVDAAQKMGDAKERLTGVMMHSAVEAYLTKKDLIDNVPDSEGKPGISTFMRKRVIVDDGMPFNTGTKVATAYLFGAGAIALGNGSHPRIIPTEIDRDSLASSGEDFLINRRIFLLHPRGVQWQEDSVEDAFPTNAELGTASNWVRVYDQKAIRVVKFTFKID